MFGSENLCLKATVSAPNSDVRGGQVRMGDVFLYFFQVKQPSRMYSSTDIHLTSFIDIHIYILYSIYIYIYSLHVDYFGNTRETPSISYLLK